MFKFLRHYGTVFCAKSYMNVPIYIMLTLAVFDFVKIAILMGMSSVSFGFDFFCSFFV